MEKMHDRPQEEQARIEKLIDGLPPWKLMNVMTDTVGAKRLAVLFGWCVLWQLQGEPSGRDLRLKLEEKGMTEASAYRALADFRRIADALLKQENYSGAGVFASLRNLGAFFIP